MRIQGGEVWNFIVLNDIDINDNIHAFKKSLKSHLLKSMQWILKDTNKIKPESIYLTKLVFFVCSLILQSLHTHDPVSMHPCTCTCSPENTFVISIHRLINLAWFLAHLTYTALVTYSVQIWEYITFGFIHSPYWFVCLFMFYILSHMYDEMYVSIKNFEPWKYWVSCWALSGIKPKVPDKAIVLNVAPMSWLNAS